MTPGPYEARHAPGIPTDCCDFGIISLSQGREVCRVWDRDDAERLVALLNAQWRSIETAPKDGRTILFRRARPFTTGINLTFGFWHNDQNVPGWQSQGGGVIVPEHWPEWMPIDSLLPADVVAWLHPATVPTETNKMLGGDGGR